MLVNSIWYSGGITGFNHKNGKILGCEVDGRIKGEEKIGGISGVNKGDIIKCSSKGNYRYRISRWYSGRKQKHDN